MTHLILYLRFSKCDDLIVSFVKKTYNLHVFDNKYLFDEQNTKMYKYLIIGDSKNVCSDENENVKTLLSLFSNKKVLGIGMGCLFLNKCDTLVRNDIVDANVNKKEVCLIVDKRFKVLSLMEKIDKINMKDIFFYNLDYDENEVKVIVETISFESIIYKKLYKDHYGLIVNDFLEDDTSICKKLIEGFLSF